MGISAVDTLIKEVVAKKVIETTKRMLDDIRQEAKVVNSIRKDVGYDIFGEQIISSRVPVEWFMS